MRLPFMQLESDFLAHGAAELANLARCTVAQAIGHVSLLRAWAVSHATDEAPPDGWVAGEAACRRIEAAAQWTGEAGALVQALCDAGQVRKEDGGLRVLHLDAYAQAWNRNATAKERMRNARARSANVQRTAGERSAEFGRQTQMQKEQVQTPSVSPVRADAQPEAQGVLSLPVAVAARDARPPDAKPKPPHRVREFAAWADEQTRHLRRPDLPPDTLRGDQWPRLGEGLALHGSEAMKAAFRLWMGWVSAQEKGYPLGMFASGWDSWVRQVKAAESVPPKRASDGVGTGQAGECAGCGAWGSVCVAGSAEERVMLGYDCGCARDWQEAIHAEGRAFHEAGAWARERRGRAA